MPIPDYQTLMLPVLELARDGREHTLREAIEAMAARFHLTNADRQELLPSGRQFTLNNRVGWASTYLKKAGLLESPKRGVYVITPRGLEVLARKPSSITAAFLEQFPGFVAFKNPQHELAGEGATMVPGDDTPEESLENAFRNLNATLAADVLQMVKSCSPGFFEQLVVDVVVAMGYGGSRADAGKAIGKSGDEGIDGIIKEDRLGLDTIYIQAKRWENPVGRPEVQKFAGALEGHRARNGIFITTAHFTREAMEYVSKVSSKIVLIDGETLAQLMVDHGVGVTPIATYQVKRIDTDYFLEG